MAIEIVDFPIKHGDFPVRYVNVYHRVGPFLSMIVDISTSASRKKAPFVVQWPGESTFLPASEGLGFAMEALKPEGSGTTWWLIPRIVSRLYP